MDAKADERVAAASQKISLFYFAPFLEFQL